jgi:hypothetical protein
VSASEYEAIERRIEWFIVAVGTAMAVGAGIRWGIRSAVGAALGTALCWLNFRWLRYGATGLIRLGLAQSGAETVHVPRSMHAKFFGRLVLLLVAVYVILALLKLPAVALICGLASVVPAILIELGYEIATGNHRWNEQ